MKQDNKALLDKIKRLEKINQVLIDRVERSVDSVGTAYSIFERNILLNKQIANQTKVIEEANKALKISNDQMRKEIIEREKAEHIVKENEERYKTLFESILDGICLIEVSSEDAKPLFVECNRSAVKMYGCTDIGQLLGKSPADFSPSTQPNGKPSVEFSRGLIRETLKGTPQYFEWEHKTLQGKLLWTEVVLNRIVLKGKYFIQAIIRDISEKKKITEAHRLVELGKLVSNMAHEVNNPLMIISGNAQLVAQMDDISNAKAQEKLEIISDQCKRAKTIIQRLLMFSKPSTGDFKYHDINKVIDDIVKLIEHQFGIQNVKIIRNFDKELPMVKIDEKMIQETFMNFLNNCMQAMENKGGNITISTSLEENRVKIIFEDTGHGIPPEDLQNIYNPFFTKRETGTGLGLSVAYGTIKAHDGRIKIDSIVGKGTRVTVFLKIV